MNRSIKYKQLAEKSMQTASSDIRMNEKISHKSAENNCNRFNKILLYILLTCSCVDYGDGTLMDQLSHV